MAVRVSVMAIIAQSTKTIAPLIGAEPVEAAVRRVDCDAFADPLVVASHDHRFLVEKQMRDCGCTGSILLEPEGKNTAPAVFATHHVMKHNGDALILITPSDHHIPDQDAFTKMVLAGQVAAEAGAIVTFGVAPDRPETGYGCRAGQPSVGVASSVTKFHEKPDMVTQTDVGRGNYLWNAGIFCFKLRSCWDMPKILRLICWRKLVWLSMVTP